MTPDGLFRAPPRPARPPIAMRVGVAALVIAVLAGVLSTAAMVFWIALTLIPVAVAAGAVAWLAFKFQVWRMRQSGGARRSVYRR